VVPPLPAAKEVGEKMDLQYPLESHLITKWFTDLDIWNNLVALFAFTEFTFIDSVDIDLLTSEKTSLIQLGIKPNFLKEYRLIFCPINISNIHWTLFVVNPKSGMCFFLDPLQSKNMHSEILTKANRLRLILIEEAELKNLSNIREYDQVYSKQDNTYDCGPFICAFAEKIAANLPLTDIDARRIRFLTYCHLPASTLAPLLEGGSDMTANDRGTFPEHLLHFDDTHIASFSFTHAESKLVTIVHPVLAKAISTHNADFLVENARLPDFHNKSFILLPLLVKNSSWILIVVNLKDSSIYIMDPMKKPVDSELKEKLVTAADTIAQLALHDKTIKICKAPHSQFNELASNSGPLICGFMEAISHNKSPTEINIEKIRRTCNSLKKRYTRFHTFEGPKISSAIPKGATLETRKHLAHNLISQLSNLPISEACHAITQHIYLLRSKVQKSNYMGLHQESKLSGEDLRKLYKQNSKRAFEIITQNISADVYPKDEDVFEYYSSKSIKKPTHPEVGGLPVSQGPILSFTTFTQDRLLETIKKLCKKKSAPGRSNITYADILYCDPDLSLHTALFNRILETGVIPDAWREFETMLIPKPMKQGNYHDVSSWRPIALLDCQYKLFTAVLASTIHQWCVHNNLLHPLQKSLGPFDGCTEHNFLIRAIFDKYSNQLGNKPIHSLFLDIADAFGTIDIEVILDLLFRMGLSIQSCELIQEIYTNCSHRVICGAQKTQKISVKLGVRQGCPLSMILFNIGINPLLILTDKILEAGITIGGHRICGLAYADDLVLIAPSKDASQKLADAAQYIANVLGLTFRSSKCSLLSIPQDNEKQISINEVKINIIKPGEIQIYLGTDLGHFTSSTPDVLFHRLIMEYTAIAHSGLTPWQKLHAKTVHIHSALIFAFRNFLIPISKIYGNKNRNTIERKIRALDKKILGLHAGASNAYLYAPRNLGGVGLTSIVDEYMAQSLTHAIQILNCRDQITRDAAIMFLRRAASGKNTNTLISFEDAIEWLNEGIQNNSASSWWSRVKYTIGKMSKLHSTRIEFHIIMGEITLNISQDLTPRNHTAFLISKLNLKETSKCLHIIFSKSWHHMWKKQPSAGRFVEAIEESNLNKSIIYSGELSFSEWFFTHQCNTVTLPLLALPGSKNKQKCRRCQQQDEDLPHVLVKCRLSDSFWNFRHNTIMYFMASQIRLHTDAEVKVDTECQFTGSLKRVDLVLKFHSSNTILLVDVKWPYQTETNIERSDESNRFYYSDLAKDIKGVMRRWTVEVWTIVVGTPGTWPALSTTTLRRIGFRSETIKTIARHCIISNIRWSTAQWRFHRDGKMPDISRFDDIKLLPSLCEPEPSTEVNLLDELVVDCEVIESENEWNNFDNIFDD